MCVCVCHNVCVVHISITMTIPQINKYVCLVFFLYVSLLLSHMSARYLYTCTKCHALSECAFILMVVHILVLGCLFGSSMSTSCELLVGAQRKGAFQGYVLLLDWCLVPMLFLYLSFCHSATLSHTHPELDREPTPGRQCMPTKQALLAIIKCMPTKQALLAIIKTT